MHREGAIVTAGRKRWAEKETRISSAAFTLIELVVAISIMAIMLTAAVMAWYGISRRADLKAAAEITMQDIRKTYASADAGNLSGLPENKMYDQYRIVINTNADNPADYPPNSYRIERRVRLNDDTWGNWDGVDIGKPYHTVVTAAGKQWAKPTSSTDFQIESITYANGDPVYTGTSEKFIAFVRTGVITRPAVGTSLAEVSSQPLKIHLSLASQGRTMDIRISNLGKVWAE